MKIFPKYYVRRLYRTNKLEEITKILLPWVDETLYQDSPFLLHSASYKLKRMGGVVAPKLFKKIVSDEILRLNELEDLKASLCLAIIESYRSYKPSKGKVDLVNWLSWNIPYQFSKLVTWRITHPIEPFEEASDTPENILLDPFSGNDYKIAIICEDLGLSKQVKYYYLNKGS